MLTSLRLSLNDDGDARRRRGRNAHTQQLTRHALNADIDLGQTDAGHSDSCHAAVVYRQVVSHALTWTMNHLEAVSTQSRETGRVRVVPCLDKEQHVDAEIAAYVEQVVEFVCD